MPIYVQTDHCNARNSICSCTAAKRGSSCFKKLPKCNACRVGKGSATTCRFKGCRTMDCDRNSVSFNFKEGKDPLYPNVFSRPLTLQEIDMKMRACADVLLPKLEAEQQHASLPNIIRRKKEVEYRVRCDSCTSSLFSQTWLCPTCGLELCDSCVMTIHESSNSARTLCPSKPDRYHLQTHLLPITRFTKEELDEAVQGMKDALKMPPPSQPPRCNPYDLHDAPKIHNDQVKFTSEFQCHWSRGVPVVVTHVQLQGAWDPQYFVAEHGEVDVILVDCETEKKRRATVAEFFGSFGKPEGRTKIEKVKDWPPSDFLADVLPQLCTDFAKSLPCPAMACLDGALNYASHFPLNAVGPDLGPKTYNALASVQDNYHSGSTKLHKDLTDAVNVMLWAAEFARGVPGCALWHIFPAATSRIINEFLRRQGFMGLGDLIHLQQVYLTPALLNLLFEQTGVRPWTILQRPGDAVYIPAGCAHQVSNQADAIKIACDYVSMDNLTETVRLFDEFREHRLATGEGDDVLQLFNVLWYAWKSLSRLRHANASRAILQNNTVHEDEGRMSIDSELGDRAVSNLASGAMAVDDPNPIPSAVEGVQSMSAKQIRKIERRRENNKKKKEHKAYTPDGLQIAGRDFECEFCHRKFERYGLIRHLLGKHTDNILPSVEQDRNLRKAKKTSKDEFMEKLKPYLIK